MVELFGVFAREADSLASARSQRRDAALEMALQVENQIELAGANPAQEGRERPRPAPAIVDQNLVEPGMALEQRLRLGLDRPRDMGARIGAAHAAEQRQRSHHVADRAKQHEKYSAWSGAPVIQSVVHHSQALAGNADS